jgi:hydroxymethylpyrimidine pyrophosphatase-like HAD family hydrolase
MEFFTMPYQLALATDLDGTFLEGDVQTKRSFYSQLESLREQVLLIYTTGRPVDTVKSFCQRGYLPYPHFVLGDHGTHIVDGKDFAPVKHLQDPIAFIWNHGNQVLRNLLQGEPGIRLQPLDPPYRVAYYYDPHRLESQTIEKIQQAGFDCILSCDMYLDILPRGVNKGSSLLKLLEYLDINHEIVITGGDSLNDLPLFQTGLRSIAVGNSELKLVEIVKQLSNVYHSQFPGLLGIIDGLQHYGYIS